MQKICVETFGCTANVSEGEIIQGSLAAAGYTLTHNRDEADAILLNICTVKGTDAALYQIRKAHQQWPNKKIIVGGCIPHELIPAIHALSPSISLFNTHNLHKTVDVVRNTLHELPLQALERIQTIKINLPKIRKNPVIGIIPISSGCDSACTFCSVKFIKGNHQSYPPKHIINEVQHCVNDGCKEIWLTGQDTGCYGADLETDLPTLLRQLVHIPGDFKIRLGMANPKHLLHHLPELIEIYRSEKMFTFLHAPVQSGNNTTLNAMRRQHTSDDFKTIVQTLRKKFPEITIATDIICGFPGETPEQFTDTLTMIQELNIDVVNISAFVSRAGTAASRMTNHIPGAEKKNRTRQLHCLFKQQSYARNKQWIGWSGEIIIDERGKNNTFVGRNYAYKPVAVEGQFTLGEKVTVTITDASLYCIKGKTT